jgi:hypothetical protein
VSGQEAPELGSEPWLAARNEAARAAGHVHSGAPWTIDVVVSGGPGGPVTYHVALEDGAPLAYRSGAAPGGASATLEQTYADAAALDRGEGRLAVAYMRGETKTKGATRPIYELLRVLAR